MAFSLSSNPFTDVHTHTRLYNKTSKSTFRPSLSSQPSTGPHIFLSSTPCSMLNKCRNRTTSSNNALDTHGGFMAHFDVPVLYVLKEFVLSECLCMRVCRLIKTQPQTNTTLHTHSNPVRTSHTIIAICTVNKSDVLAPFLRFFDLPPRTKISARVWVCGFTSISSLFDAFSTFHTASSGFCASSCV